MIGKNPAQEAGAQQDRLVIMDTHSEGGASWANGSVPPLRPMHQSAEKFTHLLNIFFCSNNLLSANVLPTAQPRAGKYTLSICLTKKELRELTLKAHYAAQARTLSEMGILHTLRPDGSPVVLHSTLKDMAVSTERKPTHPDFSSLNH